MTDASNALNPGEDGAAEALEYLNSLEAAKQETPAEEAPEAPVEDAEEAPSAEEVSDEPVSEGTTEESAPESAEEKGTTVFDDLPDEIRSDLEGLPTEIVEKLRSNILMQADYTRKTQKLAEERRQLEQIRQAAESWEALTGDPEMLDLMARAREMKASESAEEFDYANAEPTEIDERVAALVEQRLAEREAQAAQSSGAVESWRESLVEPMQEAFTASGLSQDEWLEVTQSLAGQLEAAGINPIDALTPESVHAWVKPHVDSVRFTKTQAEASKRSKADATRSARASSPAPSRTAPAKQIDKWKAEDRPATVDELRAKTLKELADSGLELPT